MVQLGVVRRRRNCFTPQLHSFVQPPTLQVAQQQRSQHTRILRRELPCLLEIPDGESEIVLVKCRLAAFHEHLCFRRERLGIHEPGHANQKHQKKKVRDRALRHNFSRE